MSKSTENFEPKQQKEPVAVNSGPSAQESEKFEEPEETMVNVNLNLISEEQVPQREVSCRKAPYTEMQERERSIRRENH